ncbi:large conductance mechanosensitive channel protein MscL [Deinococcus sp.]|uniref:large conductance mechanosensitive channel protein MscL n=1 Tax=Deinococcus sp. TaxID=47478 RepID=UPI003C7DCBA7
MINGFRDFILRGNVVDLAVGVVTGAAFGALVAAFGAAFLNPLIKLIGGGGKNGGSFFVNGVEFPYGAFITAVITFLLTMAVIYFVVVVPMTAAVNRLKRADPPAEAQPSNEEKLLVEIRDALRSR